MELNQVLKINNRTIENNIDVDDYLLREGLQNSKAGWNKLTRTMRLNLLNLYAENYGELSKLTNEDIKRLKLFLRKNLLTTKLLRVKDIVYNKEEQKIEEIIPLLFKNNKFILVRNKTKKNKN